MSRLEETFAFQVQAAVLPEPEREYRFHPVRLWRFDFAWPAAMLAVEIEGGVYTRGRHTRASGFVRDAEKYNAAAEMGWTVLRAPKPMLDDLSVLDMAKRILEETL